MPMELYSSEALIRDMVNAISKSEGKPLNIGGKHHEGIDRDYIFRLVSEAKQALESPTPAAAHRATSAPRQRAKRA